MLHGYYMVLFLYKALFIQIRYSTDVKKQSEGYNSRTNVSFIAIANPNEPINGKYMGIRPPLNLSYGNLVGVATPSPPFCGLRRLKKSTHERRFTAMKRYNTPHRRRVIKTRLTEEEYAEFSERVTLCKMSQAEFIR